MSDRTTIFIKPILNTSCGPGIVLGSGDQIGFLREAFLTLSPSGSTFASVLNQALCFPLRGPAQSPFCLAGALTPWGAAAHPSLRATSALAPLASAGVLHRSIRNPPLWVRCTAGSLQSERAVPLKLPSLAGVESAVEFLGDSLLLGAC